MKKKFKIYLIFLMFFLMFPTIINAKEKICSYFYYDPEPTHFNTKIVLSTSENGKVKLKYYSLDSSGFLGLGERVSRLLFESETDSISASVINSGICPKHIYATTSNLLDITGVYPDVKPTNVIATEYTLEKNGVDIVESGMSNLIGYTGDVGTLVFDSRTSFFANGNCNSDSGVFKLFKIIYSLLKFASPIILVIFGMIDMAKAMTSSDESKMKKAQSALIRRIIAAVIVFLSFVIVEFIVKMVDSDVLNCVNQLF